ncbi:hypothetical protein RchiOBHm_Chr5g0042861 [Rosa chinensis]|uniref:Uncharacterized protein n=1 Tax=Rosa chinensis TaxID=74649 RepID=A0A2P6QD60_ROSCH|nr:hypothetical protein RchiOBHm_Chr5g0042861 [Rosa chinensis]
MHRLVTLVVILWKTKVISKKVVIALGKSVAGNIKELELNKEPWVTRC